MKDLDELFDVLLGNWVYRVLILLFTAKTVVSRGMISNS